MWQIEDLIRANRLDMDAIKNNIIPQYKADADTMLEIVEWYDNLVEMMTIEQIKDKGHLQVITNLVNDLDRLHRELLKDAKEIAYRHVYNATLPFINEFDAKTGKSLSNEVELCLTGVYSKFLLKLQGKEISKGTEEAIKAFSTFLALLGGKYHEEQEAERTKSPE